MQARIATAWQGARWLLDGWRMFRAAPVGWLTLVFVYWLLMTLVSIVPLAGVAVASLLVPAFSVGFRAAARAASRGGAVELVLLFDGFRNERRAMAALGIAYLASLALVLAVSALYDGGELARWMITGERPSEEAMQSDAFLGAIALAAAAYAPVMMAFWFAPVLAAWHSIGAVKALFFSFFACLMNWRAFLAYGIATALVTLVLPLVALTALLMAVGGGAGVPPMGLVFPLLVVMLPTLFASFYASYRDVLGA